MKQFEALISKITWTGMYGVLYTNDAHLLYLWPMVDMYRQACFFSQDRAHLDRRVNLSIITASTPMVGTPINLVRGLIRLCTVVLIKDPVWPLLCMHRLLKWQRHKTRAINTGLLVHYVSALPLSLQLSPATTPPSCLHVACSSLLMIVSDSNSA